MTLYLLEQIKIYRHLEVIHVCYEWSIGNESMFTGKSQNASL